MLFLPTSYSTCQFSIAYMSEPPLCFTVEIMQSHRYSSYFIHFAWVLKVFYISSILHSSSKFTFNGDFCGPTSIRLGNWRTSRRCPELNGDICRATRWYGPDSFGKRLTFDTVTFLPMNFFNSELISGALVKSFAKLLVYTKQPFVGKISLNDWKFYLNCNLCSHALTLK